MTWQAIPPIWLSYVFSLSSYNSSWLDSRRCSSQQEVVGTHIARNKNGAYSLLNSALHGFSKCLTASFAATIPLNSASTILVPRVLSKTLRPSSVLPRSIKELGVSGKKRPPTHTLAQWTCNVHTALELQMRHAMLRQKCSSGTLTMQAVQQ